MVWFAWLAATAVTLAPTAPPPRPAPPLPIPPVVPTVGAGAQQLALAYDAPPASVSCDGQTVAVRIGGSPPVQLARWYGQDRAQTVRPALKFRIGPDGRPLGVTIDRSLAPALGPIPDLEAVQAELATWTFAAPPGGASGCHVDFPGRWTTLAEAPPSAVNRLLFQGGLASEDVRKLENRAGGGGDCQGDEPPFPRTLEFPRFERVAKQPGRPSWTLVGFDIDARGKTRHVRKLDGAGLPPMDQESLAAVSHSRFQPKAAKGCVTVLRRPPGPLPAPPAPAPSTYVRPGDDCEGKELLVYRGAILYPREFQRRRIEGWAMIRFDIASWGQVGAVQVLESEPAAAFGQAAVNYVSAAHAKQPGKPRIGCVVPVRFKMPELMEQAPEAGTEITVQTH